MATPVGADVITSISRTYVLPEITDVFYRSNPFFFRVNQSNRKLVSGGTQIEQPFMYAGFTNGGPFVGYQVLDLAPNDTVKNGAWDWKYQYVPVTVDLNSLVRANSPEAIANLVGLLFSQAEMQMAENLAVGLWSDGSVAAQIDGLKGAVDAGSVAPTYGGLTRSSNTWLNSQVDSTSTTLTLSFLNSLFGSAKEGGRAPTIIASRTDQYNRYNNLVQVTQRFPVAAGGHDEQLASAGFTNQLFNNVPWVDDSHVFDGPNSSNSAIVMGDEDYLHWVVASMADFYMEDFMRPPNQVAYTTQIVWGGNLVLSNPARWAKATAIAA